MNKTVRTILLIFIDMIIITGSVYTAFLLRFDFSIRPEFYSVIPYVIGAKIVLSISFLYYFKIYKRVWQYASIGDLLSIFKGEFLSAFSFIALYYLAAHPLFEQYVVPRSIHVLSSIIIVVGIGGSRFVWRMIRDNYSKIQPHHKRALIIGAGDAGTMVAKELKHSPKSEYYPIAFIDDDNNKRNLEVLGVPVVGNRNDIPEAVKKYNIEQIIIALPSASRLEIANIIEICKTTHCQIKMVPRVNDLINGKITVSMIRDVSVEDLLGREPVKVDLEEISGYLRNKVVLITGAGGSIGSELSRQVASFRPKQLLLLGHGENSIYEIELELRKKHKDLNIEPVIADIQDINRMTQVFYQYRPHVVFHAAAHKHVPMMERNPVEAIKNNIFGTKNVAELASATGAEKFVMISTDKAVNPTNVMGATKRIAEMIVQSMNGTSKTCFSAVRFGNVLGSRGSVVPLFKKQIEEGGPVTVTHPEMVRYFMTIPEAVQLVIQAGALAQGGEVFILDMGKPVKIVDLAHDLIRLSGLEPGKDIEIKYTGIRPGEKLFEELLTREEGTTATKHDRIYVGQLLSMTFIELEEKLQTLHKLIHTENTVTDRDIKNALKMIVSSYQWGENFDESKKFAVKESLKTSMEIVAALDQH